MIRKHATENRLEKEKKRRIEDVLEAAREVILLKNYTGATMDDIAAAAGISKPTIYQYFKTKDEMFIRIIEPLVQSLALSVEKIRVRLEEKKYNSGRDLVRDVFNVYFKTFEKTPDIIKLFNIFLQMGRLDQLNKDAAEKIKSRGKKSFSEGNLIYKSAIEQGFFYDTDPVRGTDLVWGTFCGIVQIEQNRWNREGLSIYLKPALEYVEDFFVKALVKK